MRLQILSDLHLELWPAEIPPTDADVIVLAGDIGRGTFGIEWAKKRYPDRPVIYVAGNQEFYGHDFFKVLPKLREAAGGSSVRFLENQAVVVDDVRFLGATLWTDFDDLNPVLIKSALQRVNDYREIGANGGWGESVNRESTLRIQRALGWWSEHEFEGRFHPAMAHSLHQETVRWLAWSLEEAFDGKTVVVTHHAPSYESLRRAGFGKAADSANWRRVGLDDPGKLYRAAAYASDLDGLLGIYREEIDLWIHGHLHHAMDFNRQGVRIVSNPRGYPPGRRYARTALVAAMSEFGLQVRDEDLDEGRGVGFKPDLVVDVG